MPPTTPRNSSVLCNWHITRFASRRSQTIFWILSAARKRSPRNNWRKLMANIKGRVVQVLGGVVDVEFPDGNVPELFEAIEVARDDKEPLILEVQKHLGNGWVRTVSMDST